MTVMTATVTAPWRESGYRGSPLARMRNPRAFRWYAGGAIGLVYQVVELFAVWSSQGSVGIKTLATAVLAVLYVLYLVLPPLVWPEPVRVRLVVIFGYWALSCVLFPLIGITTVWVWTLLAAMVGFTWIPRLPAFGIVGGIVATQLIIAAAMRYPNAISFSPFITASVGITTLTLTRLIVQNQQLRFAHAEIARLAVSDERARLARDLHDSLGHSLTVVTVKSELAGKLVGRDPVRAAREIVDIEHLARTGLSELRAAVAGYRDADIDTELIAAHTALTAAEIVEHLPHDGSAVDPDLRALFGWVIREGVTNVIRHAKARNCWIELTATSVCVRDDGMTVIDLVSAANGLRGLRERAAVLGAHVTAGPRASGPGFELVVST